LGKGLYLDFRSEPEITGLGITDWQKGNYGSIKLNKQTQIIKLITFLFLSLSVFVSPARDCAWYKNRETFFGYEGCEFGERKEM
jgi:hypothetical protein